MKKRLIIVFLLFMLVGCSSINNTPKDLEDFLDKFADEEFNNVTIETTNYLNNVVISDETLKIDDNKFHKIYIREEVFYSVDEFNLTTYISVGNDWFYDKKEAEIFINKYLTMSSLFDNMLPTSKVEDFSNDSNSWTYEETTTSVFFSTILTYTVTIYDDYIDVLQTKTIRNNDEEETTENVLYTKLYDFCNTTVTLPENSEKLED